MELLEILIPLQAQLFGMPLFERIAFFELVTRLVLNMGVIVIIVRYIYYPVSLRKDYLFTYLLIGLVVFLLCFLLDNVKLQLGFALGLFAIFGIIRYRTDTIPIKEMTYLFMVIGLSVINALANKKISYAELGLTNALVIGLSFGLERVWLLRHEVTKSILYERIDMIRPEKRAELKKDLEERTGLTINRIEIGRIDFLNDTARLRIHYYDDDSSFEESGQSQDDE